MKKRNYTQRTIINEQYLDCYDLGNDDQPTTCPKCGHRTLIVREEVNVKRQTHHCDNCGYDFYLYWR